MSVATIVQALLSGSTAVTNLAGDRIYPTILPEGILTPAVVHQEISTVDVQLLDPTQGYVLRRSRVQISALAIQFTDAAALLAACCAALMFQRGSIGAEQVVSITRDRSGPHSYDNDLHLHHHIADLLIAWRDL